MKQLKINLDRWRHSSLFAKSCGGMTRRVFMPHQSAMITTCLSFVSLINVGPSESISSSRRPPLCDATLDTCGIHRSGASSLLYLYAPFIYICPFAFSTVQPQLRDNSLRRNQSLGRRMQIACSCTHSRIAYRSWLAAYRVSISVSIIHQHGSLYILFGRQINFAHTLLFVGRGIFTVCKFSSHRCRACFIHMLLPFEIRFLLVN